MITMDKQAVSLKNKTFEYLTPLLRSYPNIISKLNNLSVIAYCIGDYFDKENTTPSFYIMIDSEYKKDDFFKFINFLEDTNYFIKYYNHSVNIYVIVIKILEEHQNAYYKFKESKYSKMFTKDEISTYFDNTPRRKTYEKLRKSEKGKQLYLDLLVNEYNIDLETEDIEHHEEYDLPLEVSMSYEIFNYPKTK